MNGSFTATTWTFGLFLAARMTRRPMRPKPARAITSHVANPQLSRTMVHQNLGLMFSASRERLRALLSLGRQAGVCVCVRMRAGPGRGSAAGHAPLMPILRTIGAEGCRSYLMSHGAAATTSKDSLSSEGAARRIARGVSSAAGALLSPLIVS